jgi:hypothetical protein
MGAELILKWSFKDSSSSQEQFFPSGTLLQTVLPRTKLKNTKKIILS